ncbi:MAG TPA: hypothetical protein VKA36_10970 [Solirubrobacterales bacterium]|nr:hypothetical protein [Solirubrobacterales bacterium]
MDDRKPEDEGAYRAPEVEEAGSDGEPAVTAAGSTTTTTTTIGDA